MRLPLWLIVVPVAVVTACGGGAPSIYAGMSAFEATQEAMSAATHEAKRERNPLRGRPLRPVKLVRGSNDVGEDAWVLVLDIGKGERACVWTWAEEEDLRTVINYSVDMCPRAVLRAPGEVTYDRR